MGGGINHFDHLGREGDALMDCEGEANQRERCVMKEGINCEQKGELEQGQWGEVGGRGQGERTEGPKFDA